ncbi:hypothetical protein CEXT_740611 [Caerostris extrusa]|uniref:Uncharacterized protein n=1 Tax=Caerostris extrusa TaxID=172846 RepID=A0AAV4NC92_CAEEX|nr:hypothetical protein CEXT_740611 [Caerostris extrusa]
MRISTERPTGSRQPKDLSYEKLRKWSGQVSSENLWSSSVILAPKREVETGAFWVDYCQLNKITKQRCLASYWRYSGLFERYFSSMIPLLVLLTN